MSTRTSYIHRAFEHFKRFGTLNCNTIKAKDNSHKIDQLDISAYTAAACDFWTPKFLVEMKRDPEYDVLYNLWG